jgi:CubicO group peptidase (beta-lactamase class C family)
MDSANMGLALPRSTPAEQGVDAQGLLSFLDAVAARKVNLQSFMLLRRGSVVADGWWRPFDPSCRRYLYSLSKSFTSTAVGLAVQEGRLTVEDRITSFFPDDLPARVDANLAAMRVKDLLTMTTGHALDTTVMFLQPGTDNWARSILTVPVDFVPGTHFLYNTGATYLLSCIVQRLTGQTVLDYLTPRLFTPLGITGMAWESCPRGINVGGWGLSLKTEDLARFGLLYLQQGRWLDRQLLDPAWVAQATSRQVRNDEGDRVKEPADWRQGYGYQFWRCQHNAFRGDGAYGQYCVVMPEKEAVLVMTSETAQMQTFLDEAWEHLLLAMTAAPLNPQPALQQELDERLAGLARDLPPVLPMPAGAAALSGRTFKLEPNALDIQSVSFTFNETSCDFHVQDGRSSGSITCGASWVGQQTWLPLMQPTMISILLNSPGGDLLRVAAWGGWKDPQTYIMLWQYLETPHTNSLTCRFLGDRLELDVESSLFDPFSPFLSNVNKSFAGVIDLVKTI